MAAADRLYRRLWRWLVAWFRVPEEPPAAPVAGPDEAFESFRPAPEFLRYLKLKFWILLLLLDVWVVFVYFAGAAGLVAVDLWWVAILLLPLTVVLVIVPDVVAYVAIHLRYDTTWYVMTERSLRIRRGIWIIHETTITFENVQNLAVRQGPVERHFGIARLIVETAGGGVDPRHKGLNAIANHGVVEGITNAEELKRRVLERLQQSETAGLGDEHDAGAGFSAAHVDELRAIREEVSQLRAT